MQKKLVPLIKKISLKHNIPEEVILSVVRSQFECARDKAKKGTQGEPDTFLNIRFKHLGLLVAKPRKIMAIHNAKLTRQNRT